MVRVRVLETIKFEGARHSPGSLINIPPHLYRRAARVGRVEQIDDQAEDSHSDQQIGLVEALLEAIPGLQSKPAAALVAAGYVSVESLGEVDNETLAKIDGVAAGSIATIREVVAAPDPGDDDTKEPDDEGGEDISPEDVDEESDE